MGGSIIMNKYTTAIAFDKEVMRHHATPKIAKPLENRKQVLSLQ